MILISGATGTIGRFLVRELSARGVPFRALVRDKERGKSLGCDYVVGDLGDPASLRPALEGIERVFLNTAPGPAMINQVNTAVDVAKQAGVSYAIKLSAPGTEANATSGVGKLHFITDAHLKESGLSWALLKPGFFMQNFFGHAENIKSQGKFYGAFRDGRISFIDAQDIASVAAALLCSAPRPGESFTLSGGEALTHAEVAQKFSAALGRTVTYVDLPVEQMVSQLISRGTPEEAARWLGSLMSAMAAGYGSFTTKAIEEITGKKPRTFTQFLDDNLAQFL